MTTRSIIPMGRPVKEERNKLLREFYANHPHLTFREVGEIFNISRQRAEVIIKEIKWGVRVGKD